MCFLGSCLGGGSDRRGGFVWLDAIEILLTLAVFFKNDTFYISGESVGRAAIVSFT